MIKKATLACLICLLAAGLFTGVLPASGAAQGMGPGLSAGTGDQQVRVLSIDDLNALKKSNTDFLLVDARPRDQYAMAHIPGAVSIPLDEIPMYAGSMDKGRLIATYCGNYHCPISTKAAMELARLGFTNVYDYKGGIKEWQDMGYAAATGST